MFLGKEQITDIKCDFQSCRETEGDNDAGWLNSIDTSLQHRATKIIDNDISADTFRPFLNSGEKSSLSI